MTLLHLLEGISFMTPLSIALYHGMKTDNTWGIVIALVLGLGLALISFCALYEMRYYTYQRTEKMQSEVAQNVFAGLSYFGFLSWIFLTSAATDYIMRFVFAHVLHFVIH